MGWELEGEQWGGNWRKSMGWELGSTWHGASSFLQSSPPFVLNPGPQPITHGSLPCPLSDSKKSEMELLEEDAMVSELVELVEKRNKLVWDLHEEKQL